MREWTYTFLVAALVIGGLHALLFAIFVALQICGALQ